MLQSLTLIEILDKSGGVISLIDSPLESMFIRATERYQTLRFSNGPTAQTVKFFYGDGDAGSNRFSGNITGTVDLASATLASLNAARIVRPEASTGFFINIAAIVANTPITVFTPAANTSGAILLSADISEFNDTFCNGGFIAKSGTVPTSITDGEPILLTRTVASYSTTNFHGGNTLPKEQFITSGLGLYFIRTSALPAANGNLRSCRYRLL
jgi:hypothetical protein